MKCSCFSSVWHCMKCSENTNKVSKKSTYILECHLFSFYSKYTVLDLPLGPTLSDSCVSGRGVSFHGCEFLDPWRPVSSCLKAAWIWLGKRNDGSGPQLSRVGLVSIYWISQRTTICSRVSTDCSYTSCVSHEPVPEMVFFHIKPSSWEKDFQHWWGDLWRVALPLGNILPGHSSSTFVWINLAMKWKMSTHGFLPTRHWNMYWAASTPACIIRPKM